MTSPFLEKMFDLALVIAKQSPDLSRKVGCVLHDGHSKVLSTGFNTLPGNCAHHDDRLARPDKYDWTQHAEARAVSQAAREGVKLAGAHATMLWYPCPQCAGILVDAGISSLVSYAPDFSDPTWGAKFRISEQILQDNKVEIQFMEGSIGAAQ